MSNFRVNTVILGNLGNVRHPAHTICCILDTIKKILLTVWSNAPVKVSNIACLIYCKYFTFLNQFKTKFAVNMIWYTGSSALWDILLFRQLVTRAYFMHTKKMLCILQKWYKKHDSMLFQAYPVVLC